MLQKLLILALAGGLGTLTRYGLSGFVQWLHGTSFPLGTVIVNIVGCFFVGLCLTLFENQWSMSGETRLFILVGFFGAFTTFSALIYETGELMQSSRWMFAAANVVFQNILGFFALFGGIMFGRIF